MIGGKTIVFLCVAASSVWCYSGGAPEDVCDDMTPKHPAAPQDTKFPYTVSVDKKEINPGEKVHITLAGTKRQTKYKGFLLEVRDKNGKAVGTFAIPDTDRFSKTINCHGTKKSAATHKNSSDKQGITLEWIAPQTLKDTVQVYATVAENGGTYWVLQPTATIKVN